MTTNHPSNDMEDKRLLELAAKAAGFEVARVSDDGSALLLVGVQRPWSPLTDDGDAFRLAVKLRLHVDLQWSSVEAWDMRPSPKAFSEELDPDPCAATRRAIVRAAASIGEKL
jgi:hypothetical protein